MFTLRQSGILAFIILVSIVILTKTVDAQNDNSFTNISMPSPQISGVLVPQLISSINLLPTSFDTTHIRPTRRSTDTLTIQNLGNSRLQWTLEESNDDSCVPSDLEWLTVNPRRGRIPSGAETSIVLRFNSTGLNPGIYTGSLCIQSNDPAMPITVVPITLSIAAQPTSTPEVTPTFTATNIPSHTPTNTPTSTPSGSPTPFPNQTILACSYSQVEIPDNGSIVVNRYGGAQYPVLDVNVGLVINHERVGDLVVSLSYNDITRTLIDRPGYSGIGDGCTGININGVDVDDEGLDGTFENSCSDSNPAYPYGTRLIGGDPADNTLMTAFDGVRADGMWQLTLTDVLTGSGGTLEEWCLIFTLPPAHTPTLTPSKTPIVTGTSTATRTPPPDATGTATSTPLVSPTYTITNTPPPGASLTPSNTVTATGTLSPTPSLTRTPTRTPSITPSNLYTPTANTVTYVQAIITPRLLR